MKFLPLSGGYRLYYDDNQFKPGIDTVLLSGFPSLYRVSRACDLGSGIGSAALSLLSRSKKLTVDCVELNPAVCAVAELNRRENGLNERMNVICADIRELTLPAGSYDLVVTNPPYFAVKSGKASASPELDSARREVSCTILEIVGAASRLLKAGGAFCMIYRLERLAEAISAMRESGLEPKRLRLIQHRQGKPAKLVLLGGKKGAAPGILPEAPLILYDDNGNETPELKSIHIFR